MADDPEFPCCSCERLMQRKQVTAFNRLLPIDAEWRRAFIVHKRGKRHLAAAGFVWVIRNLRSVTSREKVNTILL